MMINWWLRREGRTNVESIRSRAGCRITFGKTESYNSEPLASAGLSYVALSGRPRTTIRFDEVVGTRGPLCAVVVYQRY